MPQAAQEDLSVRDRGRAVALLAEGVLRHYLEFRAGLEHVRFPLVIRDVQEAVGRHGRGAMVLAQLLHPLALTGFGLEATDKAQVRHYKEVLAVCDRRWHVGRFTRRYVG